MTSPAPLPPPAAPIPARPAVGRVLARALAGRCPACGVGRVFERGLRSVDRCAACGWRFERGPGHWVGGNEVNLLVTYPVCVLAFAVPAMAFGPSFAVAAAGGFAALVFGIAAHRPARCVFFAIDYLVDPAPDGAAGDDDGRNGRDGRRRDGPGPFPDDRPPAAPPAPAPAPSRTRRTGSAPPPVELPVPRPSPRPDAEPLPRETPAAPTRAQ